ncbi:acetyl-CoA acetyltransferase, putative [Plasmodium reichenowi]|uniref:Acetyl-CoA acetyltransferase, putative n=1 Tax=Plasmodium reichenowi TaxID=5854 RepID=A0A151L5C4_PLARE|nr:acetyl-CoA acetyltransferase, putative [Plasmodium reichenowi]KYN94159.1 acetyl-CoA acetyltransferase, putative [Plasmodium reichenowi]
MLINNVRKVFIVGFARTPIGALGGCISHIPVHKLACATILKALERSQIEKEHVDCLIFGQSFSSGCGPVPLQKIAISTGMHINTKTYLVNNLCCSGLDSITIGYDLIRGGKDACVVGSMECMSQSPYFLKNLRTEKYSLGNNILRDSIIHDGYDFMVNNKELKTNNSMELFCKKYNIPRVDLDEYVINSFKRTASAYSENLIQQELFPLVIQKNKNKMQVEKSVIDSDEIYKNYNIDKICNLNSESIITNYNIAPFADGACALVLMSEQKLKELDINPIAEIITYDNASVFPDEFPFSIPYSIEKCLKKINKSFIDYYEINELSALSVIFAMKKLNIDLSNININGGALSLGHPTAVSGSRIVISLITVLKNYDMKLGCASINNYLGSSTSIIVENAY